MSITALVRTVDGLLAASVRSDRSAEEAVSSAAAAASQGPDGAYSASGISSGATSGTSDGTVTPDAALAFPGISLEAIASTFQSAIRTIDSSTATQSEKMAAYFSVTAAAASARHSTNPATLALSPQIQNMATEFYNEAGSLSLTDGGGSDFAPNVTATAASAGTGASRIGCTASGGAAVATTDESHSAAASGSSAETRQGPEAGQTGDTYSPASRQEGTTGSSISNPQLALLA